MRKYTIKRYKELGIIFFLIVWYMISNQIGNSLIIPTPKETIDATIEILKEREFYLVVKSSIIRTIKGFLYALVFGLIIGMVSGFYKNIKEFISPIIALIKSAPTMGIILLVLIWLKSDQAPILIGFLVVFPIIYANIVVGVENIDKNLIEMARIYKISRIKRFRHIYLPSIKPNIKTSLLNGFGLNLKVVIASEVISQPRLSIGNSIFLEKININTPGVFAWIFIVVFIVYIWDIISDFAIENINTKNILKLKTLLKK